MRILYSFLQRSYIASGIFDESILLVRLNTFECNIKMLLDFVPDLYESCFITNVTARWIDYNNDSFNCTAFV